MGIIRLTNAKKFANRILFGQRTFVNRISTVHSSKFSRLNFNPFTSRWSYVHQCLKLLSELKSILTDLGSQAPDPLSGSSGVPVLSPDTLSVTQQQKVSALLQLVSHITLRQLTNVFLLRHCV
jgi:hypothetical protein